MVLFCFSKQLFSNFGPKELHWQNIMCSVKFHLLDYWKSICLYGLVTQPSCSSNISVFLSIAESVHCLFTLLDTISPDHHQNQYCLTSSRCLPPKLHHLWEVFLEYPISNTLFLSFSSYAALVFFATLFLPIYWWIDCLFYALKCKLYEDKNFILFTVHA